MSDDIQSHSVETAELQSHLLRYVLLGVAMLYVIVSLYFIVDINGRLGKLEDTQKATAADASMLLKKLGMTEANLKQA